MSEFVAQVVTKSFAAADEVSGVLRLSGPAGVLQDGGQSFTITITNAAIGAGSLVLERARTGREGFGQISVAVFTGNQSALRVFARSRLSYDYRVRASSDFAGSADVELTEVDDIQRELPKPDGDSYLIIKDSGVALPAGQDIILTSPSEIIRDGLPYEPYGISRPQPATFDQPNTNGGYLRFSATGGLEGQVTDGEFFRLYAPDGTGYLYVDDVLMSMTLADGSYMKLDNGAHIFAGNNTQATIATDNINMSFEISGDWSVNNGGTAISWVAATGVITLANSTGSIVIGEAGVTTLVNASGSIGIGADGELTLSALPGAAGQVATSAGLGSPVVWATPTPPLQLYAENPVPDPTDDAPVASGTNAVSIGYGSSATGVDSLAWGTQANATADQAVALGEGATASQTQAVAIGSDASANGKAGDVAIGDGATADGASGSGTVAVGVNAHATSRSVSVGYNARSTTDGGTAIGYNADARNNVNVAVGYSAASTGAGSVCVGGNSTATQAGCTTIGNGCINQVAGAVMVGNASLTAPHTDAITKGGGAGNPGALGLRWTQNQEVVMGIGTVSTTYAEMKTITNTGRLTVPSNRKMFVKSIDVYVEELDGGFLVHATKHAYYTVTGGVVINNAGTTTLGTGGFVVTEVFDDTTDGCECQVVADDTNDCLSIQLKKTANNGVQPYYQGFAVVEYLYIDR